MPATKDLPKDEAAEKAEKAIREGATNVTLEKQTDGNWTLTVTTEV